MCKRKGYHKITETIYWTINPCENQQINDQLISYKAEELDCLKDILFPKDLQFIHEISSIYELNTT